MPHSPKKTLYLGTDPTRWKSPNEIVHYPLIRTQLLPNLPPLNLLPITHILFTSRATVKYLPRTDIPLVIQESVLAASAFPAAFRLHSRLARRNGRSLQTKSCGSLLASSRFLNHSRYKIPLAIGEGTAEALRDLSLHPILAPFPTQEGMIALLKTLDLSRAFCLYPHSRLARPLLRNFLQEANIPHFAFPLYDTLTSPTLPLPNLDEFHEVVFTSPSTVRAFLEVFKIVPLHLTLTPIGEVTERVLACAFSNPQVLWTTP